MPNFSTYNYKYASNMSVTAIADLKIMPARAMKSRGHQFVFVSRVD